MLFVSMESLLLLWSLNVYKIEFKLTEGTFKSTMILALFFIWHNGARTPGPICNLAYRIVLLSLTKNFFYRLYFLFKRASLVNEHGNGCALISSRLLLVFHLTTLYNASATPKELSRILNPFKWLTVTYLRHFISSGSRFVVDAKYSRLFFCFCDFVASHLENLFVRNEVH